MIFINIMKISFLLVFILLLSCQSKTDFDRILDKTEEIINIEDLNVDNETEEDFVLKLKTSSYFLLKEHFVEGDEDEIISYFESKNVFSYDDMIDVLFTSIYRKRKEMPLELEKQLENKREKFDIYKKCIDKRILKAKEYFNKYEVRNTVLVFLPYNDNQKTTIEYPCPNSDWSFNENKDVVFKCVVLKKYDVDNNNEYFFDLKILDSNKDSIEVLSKKKTIGDTLYMSLNNNLIKDARDINYRK